MSHTPHELAEEFPDHIEQMHALKVGDAHFASLADKYHELNRAVHRAETNVEPTDDAHMAELRKERLGLKDEIWSLLSKTDA
ncbi:YdcH family protein [Aestuariibius sp. HNIBRBA575]|uniref:YdcH family protein n=1 Tax=Aestuariibius sp. HNIBRBA575 TaxID=3233343 RepID=UPI0034A171F2